MKKEQSLSMIKKGLSAVVGLIVLSGVFSGDITALQVLPFFVYFVLAILEYFGKPVNIWIFMLAVLMMIINLSVLSWVDVVVWILIGAIYLYK